MVWIVIGTVFVLGTIPGLYGFGYDGVDCVDGLLFAGLDVGEKSGIPALRLHHGLVPGEVVGPERALNPVYDGFEGAGSGRGCFVGVGLQATSNGNEDVDHVVGQVESICSVLVPRSIVEVFVVFVACLYFGREGFHGGWGERVGVDGGLDRRVVVERILSGGAVGNGFDGFGGATMLGCFFDVLPLLFGGDVLETGEEGVDVGQNGGHVADGLEVCRS